MEISRDISIGEGKWIKWIEFDAESAEPIDIDTFLESTKEFWKYLEVECVAECCGIDAFSFWKDDIQNAIDKAGIPNLEISISKAIKEIESLDEGIIKSSHLNQLFNKKVFLQLLKHVLKTIKRV